MCVRIECSPIDQKLFYLFKCHDSIVTRPTWPPPQDIDVTCNNFSLMQLFY